MILIYLSSGLFLGWSLGANDASNIFGTAVGTRMVKFRTAAIVASIFVILGAVHSGSGAAHTLGQLGSINAMGGAFMVALAAGFTVFWMTRLKLPVSTSQAIVGAIVGWNFFAGMLTDYNSLLKIVFSWVISPILAGIFAVLIYLLLKRVLRLTPVSILRLDVYTRAGLIVVGAFGAYSLGANNIANVMGVFIPAAPFEAIQIAGINFSGTQQLFLLGSLAIAVGIFTYSHKVMQTVGNKVVKLNPQSALVVVLAEALVLFLFASADLHNWLISHNLPALPLVPVSSSQLVVGGVIGIGIVQGGKTIKYRIAGKIAAGWVITPIIAALIAFFALFFLKNVFEMKVSNPVSYRLSKPVVKRLRTHDIIIKEDDRNKKFKNAIKVKRFVNNSSYLSQTDLEEIVASARVDSFYFSSSRLKNFQNDHGELFSENELQRFNDLKGQRFSHEWQLRDQILEKVFQQKKAALKNEENNHKLELIKENFKVSHQTN
ncbi:MAG TPA: inorganic phosphate transporter [bacterium]|nr:inorganic phosphate transporter [bacterium]